MGTGPENPHSAIEDGASEINGKAARLRKNLQSVHNYAFGSRASLPYPQD